MEILSTGELRIGIDPSNPPFAFPTVDGYDGLEIDLSRMLAERLGTRMRFVGLGFDGLYDALAADQVDVVIATVPIDYTRLGAFNYSLPYFNAGLVLVSEENITSMGDLSHKRLGFEYGSLGHIMANEWLRRLLPYHLEPFPSPKEALDAVRVREVDAALVDSVSVRLYLKIEATWNPQISYVSDRLFAAVTRADRPDLTGYIGEAIEEMLTEGEIERLIKEWL